VSDDSTDGETRRLIEAEFSGTTFLEGPRKGLGANRNNALRAVSATHVLFIDDDVTLSPDFFERVSACYESHGLDPNRVIVSGTEINRGERIYPHKPSFLGFQAIDYQDGERLQSVVINSTVFPLSLFELCQFDESLVYGCDEIDISRQAVYAAGYRIHLEESAANHHFPSTRNRDYYRPFIDASRIYVTYKGYRYLQKQGLKAAAFLLFAYSHNLISNVKRGGWRGVAEFLATTRHSLRYLRRLADKAARCGALNNGQARLAIARE
jgi:glycosyltransferase involved in cell wall biosynthesis